ncbi:DUF6893 family small protein [Embleya hyalina]|uniref:Uncharacterized protein n=1 Tax=Embleya hyalina TaxID=516124 RepID=A0A401Z1V9_9ACTN|nr:hypothetical protein EHYA_08502 [Embleya hyalina]
MRRILIGGVALFALVAFANRADIRRYLRMRAM